MVDSTVWVAAVSAGGALAGSGLTGFLASRVERRKTEAAERQAERQQAATDRIQVRELQVEHQRWRRDRRQAAYASFLLAVDDLRHLAESGSSALAQGIPDHEHAEELRSSIEARFKDARTALATVRLEGPRALGEAADQLHGTVTICARFIQARLADSSPQEGLIDVYLDLTQAIQDSEGRFLGEAEKALSELMEAS
ncbi:hypothetical protein [Kitasatospora cineracea]|uniref:hypothetical protein n=1 Tax=Kitasatospora cineracea TaxID=88074 RepID=UPI0036D132F8